MNTTTAPDRTANQSRPTTHDHPTTQSRPTAQSRPTTQSQETRISPTADRGVLGDVMGFRPSATLGREMFAIAMNILIIGAFAIVFQPPLAVCVIGGVIAGVILLVRLAAGFATEGYAAQLKGEN